jgi:hypothetical protein
MAGITIAQLNEVKSEVKCHDEFINGNGTVGAKARLHAIEIKLNFLLWISGLAGSVFIGFVVYFTTRVMPAIFKVIGTP